MKAMKNAYLEEHFKLFGLFTTVLKSQKFIIINYSEIKHGKTK